MAQANVAREPSMEEILASIRKIIESNEDEENVEAQSGSPPNGQEEGETGRQETPPVMQAANEQVRPKVPREAAGRQERAPAPQAPVQRSAGTPAAAAQKTPQADAGAAARAAMQTNKRPVSLAEVAAEAENASAGDRKDVVRPRPEESAVAVTPRQETPQSPPDQPRSVDDAKLQQPAATVPPAGGRSEADRPEARALISAEAGAKVAASFTGLNQALVKGPDRSFEQMAEDMLRPMLQQWLDDNLPTLVERLVREEIERVARGS